MNWHNGLKGRFAEHEPLKDKVTFRIGGPARYFAEPSTEEDLRGLLRQAAGRKIKVLVMGAGSNLLVDDRGVLALVIRLAGRHFQKLVFKGPQAQAGAGVILARFIKVALEKGLGGHEFLAGIPGTIGGAIAMNAGQAAGGKSIGDLIDSVRVMDYNGNIKILHRTDLKLGYRSAGLERYIVLSAVLKLRRADRGKVRGSIKEWLLRRSSGQDLKTPSAGCIFRNPQGDSAGRLIEAAGLKGIERGAAEISRKHANFIVNRGGAAFGDVRGLMRQAQSRVKKKFRVRLEPEVKVWRNRPQDR